jgi:hypothetical protein
MWRYARLFSSISTFSSVSPVDHLGCLGYLIIGRIGFQRLQRPFRPCENLGAGRAAATIAAG